MSTQPKPFNWNPAPLEDKSPRITSYYRTADGGTRTKLTPTEIAKAALSGEGRLWVDVDCQHTVEWLALAQTLNFHPLTIEDTLSPESRLKIEEYEGYLFVVAQDASFNVATEDPYDFETCNIYFFLGRNYLFTVHAQPSRATSALADRLQNGPDIIDRGVDYLAYAVLDTLIDLYFPMLDDIDEFVDKLETAIFEESHTAQTLEQIFDLKRTLLALRKHQAPMREIVSTMANRPSVYVQPATQTYLRDVYDHIVRQIESIETYRDLLSGALEIYFSVSANRTNETMKALAIVGTFLLPATWVASIYGMNFEWMPFLHDRNGFWIAMAGMLGVSLVVYLFLKTKRWV